mgnify:CR=1 FL=1
MQLDILPDLPRKLNKREASVTSSVLKWFKTNYPSSCALEIKATNKNSIPASALLPHQYKALIAVKNDSGITFKIPDTGHMKLPFDAFFLKHIDAFVVACFTKNRICLAIDPLKWKGAKPDSVCEFSFTP